MTTLIFVHALSALAAATGASGTLPDCLFREYTKRHMAKHPDQPVIALALLPSEGRVIAILRGGQAETGATSCERLGKNWVCRSGSGEGQAEVRETKKGWMLSTARFDLAGSAQLQPDHYLLAPEQGDACRRLATLADAPPRRARSVYGSRDYKMTMHKTPKLPRGKLDIGANLRSGERPATIEPYLTANDFAVLAGCYELMLSKEYLGKKWSMILRRKLVTMK